MPSTRHLVACALLAACSGGQDPTLRREAVNQILDAFAASEFMLGFTPPTEQTFITFHQIAPYFMVLDVADREPLSGRLAQDPSCVHSEYHAGGSGVSNWDCSVDDGTQTCRATGAASIDAIAGNYGGASLLSCSGRSIRITASFQTESGADLPIARDTDPGKFTIELDGEPLATLEADWNDLCLIDDVHSRPLGGELRIDGQGLLEGVDGDPTRVRFSTSVCGDMTF